MSDKKEFLAMPRHDDSRIFQSLSVYPELVDAANRLKSMNITNSNTCWLLKQVHQQQAVVQQHVPSQ